MIATKASELIAALQAENEKRGYDVDVVLKLSWIDVGNEIETVWSRLEDIEFFNGTVILKG